MATVVYPEGDCEPFDYDDHNNQTDLWKVDTASACNTGAGSTHVLHASAAYDQTWNKPLSVTDARNNTTTLTYFASGNGKSLLQTATRPAIAEGTPVYSFTYDSKGKVASSVVPLTQTPAATSVTTTYNNDPVTENLTSTTLDPTGVNATTSFLYDANGDVTQTTDPRTFVTTSTYDKDRRKTEDDHHNGGATAALNAASRIQYDDIGRDIEDDAGTTFSGTTVTAWQMVKQTGYTPTSTVATVTDADSRVTTNHYDDGDRLYEVSDPLARNTRFFFCALGNANCAANQVKWEFHAWTSGQSCTVSGSLQECYRRTTYYPDGEERTVEDANNNITWFYYDPFVRLNKTTFPDTTFEQLVLDENGNVTQRTNRAGQNLTYQYNVLNWVTQKVSPSPADTTSWTYLLDGHVDVLSDTLANTINYTYDTAARLTSVATKIPGLSNKNTSYLLDANGNRTKLHWQDAYYVGYCYDNLNRMTAVMENSTDSGCATNLLATYQYDPLSRRQQVTYGNGASMAYTYTNASDLLTLNHDMTGTSNDPHYTFTYTNAHELLTEANSDADYVWQPSTNASTSYTPNNLNQYTAIGTQTTNGTSCQGAAQGLSYDCNGNLTYDGNLTYGYDAENRLMTASKTGLAASYQYDPLGRRTRKSGTGVTNTFYLSDGADEIAEFDGTSGAITARYIPGPAIDEPIAMVTAAGAKTYFHTNHQGSVIAMSGSGGALAEGPYTYDPYGNCFAGSSPCTTGEPYRFTGRRFDPETGLLYYRARYYDSQKGRFLQTDPIGYTADLNLYTYVGNDPMDRTDPDGWGPVGWVVKLTEKGLIRLRPLFDKSAAAAARRAGKNVEVTGGRQAAGSIERAAAGNPNDVMRHAGHDLGDDTKGVPHFQTDGQIGHTFYDLGTIIGSALAVLDVIDQLDTLHIQDIGCTPVIERCEGVHLSPQIERSRSATPTGATGAGQGGGAGASSGSGWSPLAGQIVRMQGTRICPAQTQPDGSTQRANSC